MTEFIEVRAMAGMNYIRASEVIAVQHVDTQKSAVLMAGGATLQCSEPARAVIARLQAALVPASQTPTSATPTSETPDGDGSR